jgi:hypothetical protein
MVLARGASESGAQVVRAALDLWLAQMLILVGGNVGFAAGQRFHSRRRIHGLGRQSRQRLCNASSRRSLDGGQFIGRDRGKTAVDSLGGAAYDHARSKTLLVEGVITDRGDDSSQGDFGNCVLAFERFPASFEIDVLGEALQIICAPVRMCCFPLHGLNAGRLDARSVQVGKIDDA